MQGRERSGRRADRGLGLELPFLNVLFQGRLNSFFFGPMLPQSQRFFNEAHKIIIVYNKIFMHA
jgi:hypothetical protein